MPREVINRIFKTKLALRIWLYTVIPTLTVLFFIGFSLNSYFNKYTLANSLNAAKNESAYVALSFSDTYKDIIKRLVLKTASTDFRTDLVKILNCKEEDYTRLNNDLQSLFTDYTQMNDLIESVMIARTDKNDRGDMFFNSYYFHIMSDIRDADLGFDLSKSKGITILPATSKPFRRQSDVVPIVISLKYDKAERMVLLSDSPKDTDAILYLFLSTTEIKKYLELYCKDAYQGTLYFVNSQGQNMSLSANMSGYPLVTDSTLTSYLENSILHNKEEIYRNENHIYINQIDNLDLYLVNIIPHTYFTVKSENMQTILLWIALISVLAITGSCFIISLQVTRPLKKLMFSVHAIEKNTYTGPADIRTKDEIGQLNQSIHSMNNTIQQQFTIIIEDEKEKYNAKMQLLTEQMNPHFLYNALEFINMEVIGNHPENASLMISSLGDYLRISLASGDNLLPISQEIKQVIAYVNIMSYRFRNNIQITTNVPDELLSCQIIKCILQPLVENSLKHGFHIGPSIISLLPIVDITMELNENHLILTVTDNGAGIDITKAREIMLNGKSHDSDDKHMGLHNIYQRLTAYYGDVRIDFTSVPFYENKVIITLPRECFLR